ncbi:MAG: site-specific DNA-methyltransferase [Prevotella sp.]|nr:site-specific DNA-methyltransferase [Prevotella sp.]
MIDGKTVYIRDDINSFFQTQKCQELINGCVDERNQLNDLTGKEWIAETKSYFYQKGLGKNHPEAQIEKLHPAPFSFQDIEKLILFFTKQKMTVLDPFGGVGSTAKACERTGRLCISIELSKKYHDLSIKRLETEVEIGASQKHRFINGDSCLILPTLNTGTVDFVVTSPPYWGILHKQDQKVINNRVKKNLDTVYSDDDRDLGNISNYNEFLDKLCEKIFFQCARVLRRGKYMAIIVSDFRDKGEFVSFHSDLIKKLDKLKITGGGKLVLQGTKILIQNHKSLHPYGYPFSYVENIHHQYILIFKKK